VPAGETVPREVEERVAGPRAMDDPFDDGFTEEPAAQAQDQEQAVVPLFPKRERRQEQKGKEDQVARADDVRDSRHELDERGLLPQDDFGIHPAVPLDDGLVFDHVVRHFGEKVQRRQIEEKIITVDFGKQMPFFIHKAIPVNDHQAEDNGHADELADGVRHQPKALPKKIADERVGNSPARPGDEVEKKKFGKRDAAGPRHKRRQGARECVEPPDDEGFAGVLMHELLGFLVGGFLQ